MEALMSAKGGLVSIFGFHLDLIEAFVRVEGGEESLS
jgi:hypothetical protein